MVEMSGMADMSQSEREVESMSGPSPADIANYATLVADVQNDVPGSVQSLYTLFNRGIRFYLCRHLGPEELEDRIHDTFVIVLQAIRRGDIREPERLMGFVRTIVRRQVANYIDQAINTRRDVAPLDPANPVPDENDDPEQSAMRHERVQLVLRTLEKMTVRDREVLTRFYLQEETQEHICDIMNLTETQFRLLKSRAKARFGELGRKDLLRATFAKRFLR